VIDEFLNFNKDNSGVKVIEISEFSFEAISNVFNEILKICVREGKTKPTKVNADDAAGEENKEQGEGDKKKCSIF
jgi:hypothetical protein